jgi:four helix bundle protein
VSKNIIEDKSFQFAVRIVNLYKYLTADKKEYVMSKQLLKCGTSIGANVAEAERGQSKADFYAKLSIGLKEAHETYYWLRLLKATEYLSNEEFVSMEKDIKEIIALLMAICKITQQNQK